MTSRLRFSNLPAYVDDAQLRAHVTRLCPGVEVTDARVIYAEGKSRGFGFVGLLSAADAERVLAVCTDSFINTRKVAVEPAVERGTPLGKRVWSKRSQQRLNAPAPNTEADAAAIAEIKHSKALLVRGLPFSLMESALRAQFAEFGTVAELRLFYNKENHFNGTCAVTFVDEAAAVLCFGQLHGATLGGRVLTLAPHAGSDAAGDAVREAAATQSASKRRLLEKHKAKAADERSYNLLFVSHFASVAAVAEMLGVDEAELLDLHTKDSLAAKVAVAESIVLRKVREWLAENQLSEELFEFRGSSLLNTRLAEHEKFRKSDKVLVLKHLGPWVDEGELRKLLNRYGRLAFFKLCPTKTVAVAGFENPAYCANVLKQLQFYCYNGYPLYFEPGYDAFDELFEREQASAMPETGRDLHGETAGNAPAAKSGDAPAKELAAGNALYVSNLSFETGEEALRSQFAQFPGFVKAMILRSKKHTGSLGHGFVTFDSPTHAADALKRSLNLVLDGRCLTVQFARSDARAAVPRAAAQPLREEWWDVQTPRAVVKNLAFEVSKKDLLELFQAYAAVKSVRVPKKASGRSRGFAFVEFHSLGAMFKALQALQDVHLMGRRLVFLPAKEDAVAGEGRNELSATPEPVAE